MSGSDGQDHPTTADCQSCGACCAPAERWKTYVEVTASDRHRLPLRFSHQVTDNELATRRRRGGVRCVALIGTLGESVQCEIYEQRPEACRSFEAGSSACHEARREVLNPSPLTLL